MKTKLLISLSFLFLNTAIFAQVDQKFAYVNSDSVMRSMSEYKIQMKTLESYAKQLQTQYQTKQQSMQQKIQDYQANAADWVPDVLQEKQKEINELDSELKSFPQTYQFSVQRKQQELMSPLMEKVEIAISKVAKEESVNFVFPDQSLLFSQEKLDLTAKVIAKVNTVE